MMFEELEPEKIEFIAQYVRSLKMVFQNLKETKDEIEKMLANINSEDDVLEHKLLMLIRSLTNNVYSGCEIINEMLRTLYRYDDRYRGGGLANGFSSNFKAIYRSYVNKEEIKNNVYTDRLLVKFYLQTEKWYVILHDIRTQETHYSVGYIVISEKNVYYKNANRNGISKSLYMNPDKEINILITDVLNFVGSFLETETDLCGIICKELARIQYISRGE